MPTSFQKQEETRQRREDAIRRVRERVARAVEGAGAETATTTATTTTANENETANETENASSLALAVVPAAGPVVVVDPGGAENAAANAELALAAARPKKRGNDHRARRSLGGLRRVAGRRRKKDGPHGWTTPAPSAAGSDRSPPLLPPGGPPAAIVAAARDAAADDGDGDGDGGGWRGVVLRELMLAGVPDRLLLEEEGLYAPAKSTRATTKKKRSIADSFVDSFDREEFDARAAARRVVERLDAEKKNAAHVRRVLSFTPVPVRPRRRGERRSLRTLSPGVRISPPRVPRSQSRHTATPFNATSDAFQLHPDVGLNDGPSTLSEWRGKTEDEMEREDAAAIAAIPDAEVEDMLRTPLEARAVAALRERMARAEDGDEYEVYGEDEEEDEEKGGVRVKGEAAPAATEPETAERPTRPKVAATTTTTPPPRPKPKPKPKPPATRKSTRRG